jgi:hypothetical protein
MGTDAAQAKSVPAKRQFKAFRNDISFPRFTFPAKLDDDAQWAFGARAKEVVGQELESHQATESDNLGHLGSFACARTTLEAQA